MSAPKKARYRFKSGEIKVMRVSEILKTPEKKLPRWIRAALRFTAGRPRSVWITPTAVHYWTRFGGCTLRLGPKDYLVNLPPLRSEPNGRWEITGYLQKAFRKYIEKY